MINRFEDKYRLRISYSWKTRSIFFQQMILCITFLLAASNTLKSQDNYDWVCITPTKDTVNFKSRRTAEQFMRDKLEDAFNLSYATAHWQLSQLDTIHHRAYYTFISGRTIYKGQIKSNDPSIIDGVTLARLLFWKPNTPYNSINIDDRVLNELRNSGLDLTYHQIFFTDSIADLRISIGKIPRNQFQGLLGTINQDNKTVLIGEIKSQWVNSFKNAEKFFFHWQRQSISTQRLQCEIEFPVLFKSPFGIQQSIELYRNQNLYFIVSAEGGLNYRTFKGGMIQAKYETKNHNALIQSQTIQHRLLGLGVVQNPIQWREYTVSLNFGFLQGFKKNIDLEVEEKSPLMKSELNLFIEKKWKRFFTSITVHQRGIFLQKSIAQIEKNRIGGTETIRGFGQESIFCKNYLGSQFETGWSFSDIGRLFFFYDQGWIENTETQKTLWQGVGFGSIFNVPDGQIEISSGWGIPDGQRFDLRNNLIHIQYQVFF